MKRAPGDRPPAAAAEAGGSWGQPGRLTAVKKIELSSISCCPHHLSWSFLRFHYLCCRTMLLRKGGWYSWKPSSRPSFSIRAFRAQIYQFELFELILLLKLDRRLPIEQFEATVSQSTVPSSPPSYYCVACVETVSVGDARPNPNNRGCHPGDDAAPEESEGEREGEINKRIYISY